MNPAHAKATWPAVVVLSVFQTGLNLMRDLIRRGVNAVGADSDSANEGFRSRYGRSFVCPNPDSSPAEWLDFMVSFAGRFEKPPVLIAAADQFVSAMGRHATDLTTSYTFSPRGAALQAELATKERQYALAERIGFPCPPTAYVRAHDEIEGFSGRARFPCVLKPLHQREWELLPMGHPLRGRKLALAQSPSELLSWYSLVEPHAPHAVAQEVIEGPDSAKYCYIAAYALDGRRLGFCVVREWRSFPPFFGSASVVEPVVDGEIARLCDEFLRGVSYAGLVEIEVKRDVRDEKVKLIEVNPRFSGTGDCASHMGVDVGWLHYLDLIGEPVSLVEPSRYGFRHVTLRRDVQAIPEYFRVEQLTWSELRRSYRPPLAFFDLDPRDPGLAALTLEHCARSVMGRIVRKLGIRK